MVHYTEIDLTGVKSTCSSYLLGRENENATEVIRLIVPPMYAMCKFVFDFRLEDGSKYSSAKIDYNDNGKIEYSLPQHVLRKGVLVIGIRAEDAATGFVKRCFERSFVCSENITSEKEDVPSDVLDDLVSKVNLLYDLVDFSVLERLAISEAGDLLYDGKIVVTKENLGNVEFFVDDDGTLKVEADSSYIRYDETGRLQVLIDGSVTRINEQGKLEVLVNE